LTRALKAIGLGLVVMPGQTLLMLEYWAVRANQRRTLIDLPDYLLKDIGVSRADAEREAGKPFWRD
jgi:uncharacterized protein YjiS (DUF1127 family)